MALERVATDVVADDLINTYRAGTRRLEHLLRESLERGIDPDRIGTEGQRRGDATAAYRQRQLTQARAIIADLERQAAGAPTAVRRAYHSGLLAVDRTAIGGAVGARARLAGRFGGIHQRAVETLAANLERSLAAGAARAGQSVELVFERAAAITGPLEAGGLARARNFIGRRADDPWRRLALEELGSGQVTLETRRQITANLKRRLVREGMSDGVTALVDRAGRRWSLDTYAEMVTRTTTREATTRATVNRMDDHGIDLVTVSSHPHAADICTPYDGSTFSRTGDDARYPRLEHLPPFHPNCRHVLTPAGVELEDFERELAIAAEQATATGPATGTADALEDVLDVRAGSGPKLRLASEAIAQTHRLPDDLPRIPFNGAGEGVPAGASGAYSRTRGGDALGIGVIPNADLDVVVHEVGHFLDHKAFGDKRDMASESGPLMAELIGIAENTAPIRRMREGHKTGRLTHPRSGATAEVGPAARQALEYNLRRREIFARVYEQVILRRAGIRSARHRDNVGFEFWDDAELDELEGALLRILEARGLLK